MSLPPSSAVDVGAFSGLFSNTSRRPLYRVNEAASGGKLNGVLEVHPDWAHYLKENIMVVRGWAAWNWCQYMSSKKAANVGAGL